MFAEEGRAHAVTLLTRLARRRKESKPLLDAMLTGRLDDLIDPALEVATETGQPLGTTLAECFEREGSEELAEWLAYRLSEDPYTSVWPLHDLGLRAIQRLLEIYRKTWTSPGPREREILAALVHNQGRRLVTLGRAAEALPVLQEACSLYKELGPEKESERIQCLGTYSEAFTQLGRLSEALTLAKEAVAASQSESRSGDRLSLAGHLINLCGCLSDVDRHGDALATIDEAVALYRENGWEGHALEFARALLCQGNELYHLGRYEEAMGSLEEAIRLSRDLENERATAFEPDLALALADLSLLYEQSGQLEKARQALQEAVDRFRRLEERYTESFRPSLAWSLSLLTPAGREAAASVAARTEAVEHYRQLNARQPAVYEPLLGQSLLSLSESLLAAGELRAALQASNDAVARLRRVALNRRDLGWSLFRRGSIRAALGHRRKALADHQQAVAIFRQRPAHQTAFYKTDLAVALHDLSIRYHDLGSFEKAIAVTREAAGIYHHLAASSPQIFTEDLASCLNSLSHHLYEAGQVKESVAAGRKVIKLYRQILACTPEAAAGLAAALSNLAPRLCELGQPAQALRHSKEAVKIYRRKGDNPEGLATALHSAAASLLDLDRPREALPCLQEAVEIRSNLAADRARNSEVDLAASMVALGRCFNDQGRCQEAVAETRRGIRLLRRAVKREGEFLRPRLAMALSNQAHQLRELGEQQAAFKSAQEAISLLAPFFIEKPAHFWKWASVALGQYLQAAEGAGQEPDLELIGEMIAAFAREEG